MLSNFYYYKLPNLSVQINYNQVLHERKDTPILYSTSEGPQLFLRNWYSPYMSYKMGGKKKCYNLFSFLHVKS